MYPAGQVVQAGKVVSDTDEPAEAVLVTLLYVPDRQLTGVDEPIGQ